MLDFGGRLRPSGISCEFCVYKCDSIRRHDELYLVRAGRFAARGWAFRTKLKASVEDISSRLLWLHCAGVYTLQKHTGVWLLVKGLVSIQFRSSMRKGPGFINSRSAELIELLEKRRTSALPAQYPRAQVPAD